MFAKARVVLFAAACGTFVPASEAAAQDRQGFWFGIGFGPGSAGVQCSDCFFNDRRTDGSGILKGGWTLNPQVLIGLELDVWAQERPPLSAPFSVALSLYNVSATLTYYPVVSSGFFVKGGAGGSMADLDGHVEGNAVTISLGSGPGVIVGAGYDFAVWRRVSLTAGMDYWYGRLGNVTLLGDPLARNWSQNIVVATFGITVP